MGNNQPSYTFLTIHSYKTELFLGNHTIAIVKSKEDYDLLKQSLGNVTREVNHLVNKGFLMIDRNKVELEFYLGGDYKVKFNLLHCKLYIVNSIILKTVQLLKDSTNVVQAIECHGNAWLNTFPCFVFQFLLIAMGMKGATSNNSCIWCKLHKNER